MIIRVVKLSFRPDKVESFKEIFENSKEKIRAFEGCSHLKLLRDINNPNTFFTYSHWESPAHLEGYRVSELFKATWEKTKILFANKPEAWSVEELSNVNP